MKKKLLLLAFLYTVLSFTQSVKFKQPIMNHETNENFLELKGGMTFLGNSMIKYQVSSEKKIPLKYDDRPTYIYYNDHRKYYQLFYDVTFDPNKPEFFCQIYCILKNGNRYTIGTNDYLYVKKHWSKRKKYIKNKNVDYFKAAIRRKYKVDGFTPDNNQKYLAFNDIDNDDSTDNSSSCDLKLSECASIKYVGLYWGGTYPYDDFHEEDYNLVWDPYTGYNQYVPDVSKRGKQTKNWRQVKLKLPGQTTYTTINADQDVFPLNTDYYMKASSPGSYYPNHYICYKDLTNEVKALGSNFNGTYMIADVKASMDATKKSYGSGIAAGWNMVIVYEDIENGKTRYFTTFNGHDVTSSNSNNVNITVQGFKTLEKGNVDVDILIAALEGEKELSGDQFSILPNRFEKRPYDSNYQALDNSSAVSNKKNFFNSSLTDHGRPLNERRSLDGSIIGTNPSNFTNTLGFDTHMFSLPNSRKDLLVNGDTKAMFRFSSSGDLYFPFLFGFQAEVKLPILTITNTIHTGGTKFGEDNENANNLGKPDSPAIKPRVSSDDPPVHFFYDVCFENQSTEDIENVKLVNELPFGVDLVESTSSNIERPVYIIDENGNKVPNLKKIAFNLEFSDGIKYEYSKSETVADDRVKFYSYKAPTATEGAKIVLLVGRNFVKKNLGYKCLRLKAELKADCKSLTDACAEKGGNQVFASYMGVESHTNVPIKDSPGSYSTFDLCQDPSISIFKIDTSVCQNLENASEGYICIGQSLELVAGSDFITYEWYKESGNGNYIRLSVDSSSQPIDETSNKLSVNLPGKYKVVKSFRTATDPNGNLENCSEAVEYFSIQAVDDAKNPFTISSDPNNPNSNQCDAFTVCTEDGGANIAEFYLCGNDNQVSNQRDITLDYADAVTVTWKKLVKDGDASAVPSQDDQCAKLDPDGWKWVEVPGKGDKNKSFLLKEPGDYKLETKLGNCPKDYYFRVFNTKFTAKHKKLDILCGNNGLIQIQSGITAGNDYQILLQKKDAKGEWQTKVGWQDVDEVPFNFDIDKKGVYQYVVKSNKSKIACPFKSGNIDIDESLLNLKVVPGKDITCNLIEGKSVYQSTLTASVNDIGDSYNYDIYEITDDNPNGIKLEKSKQNESESSYVFTVDAKKKYKVVATTTLAKLNKKISCEDSVTDIKFNTPEDLSLTVTKLKDITCKDHKSDAIVKLTGSGGVVSNNPYEYFLVKDDGSEVSVGSGISTQYTIAYDANIKYPKTYTFKVIRTNSCYTTSTINVDVEEPYTFGVTAIEESCADLNSKGSITVKLLTPTKGTPNKKFQYALVGTDTANNVDFTQQTDESSHTFANVTADTYTVKIKVTDNGVKDSGGSTNEDDGTVNADAITYSCDYSYSNITVNPIVQVTGGTVVKNNNVGCDKNGKITFTTPSTGTAPFTYFVVNKDNTAKPKKYTSSKNLIFDDIIQGEYEVYILDSKGCKQTFDDITVSDKPVEPNFITSDPGYACDGNPTVTVTPLDKSYIYELYAKADLTKALDSNNTGKFTNIDVSNNTNFVIKVNYGSGCISDIDLTLLSGKKFSTSLSQSSKTKCFGDTNAVLSLTVNNFNPTTGFWYKDAQGSFINSKTSPVEDITGFTAGNVSIPVYFKDPNQTYSDSSQCEEIAETIIEGPTSKLELDAIQTPTVTCKVTTTSITPSATGGYTDVAYVFEISSNYDGVEANAANAQWTVMSGNAFTDLTAGTYYVRVHDSGNCYDYSDPIVIVAPKAPEFELTEVEDCDKRYGNDADIKVTLKSGDASVKYQYQIGSSDSSAGSSWLPKDGFTFNADKQYIIESGAVVNTDPNTSNFVNIRRVDATDCEGNSTITIKEKLDFSATPNNAPFCKDGSFTISDAKGGNIGSGYTFAYVAKGEAAPSSTIFKDLESGKLVINKDDIPVGGSKEFDLYIKDANDCMKSKSFTISRDAELTITAVKVHSCSETSPKIKVKVSGGKKNYVVTLVNIKFSSKKIEKPIDTNNEVAIDVVENSNYRITVKDANDCTAESKNTISFDKIKFLDASKKEIANPVCKDDKGIIKVTKPSKGSGNYTYTLTYDDAGTVKTVSPVTTSSDAIVSLEVPKDGVYTLLIEDADKLSKLCPQTIENLEVETIFKEDLKFQLKDNKVSYDCEGNASFTIEKKSDETIPSDVLVTYVLDGDYANSNTTGEFTVSPGAKAYVVTVIYSRKGEAVSDSSACKDIVNVPVEANKAFTVSEKSLNAVKCLNGSDGELTINVNNFGSSFYYEVVGTEIKGTGNTSPFTIPNLTAGAKVIKVAPSKLDFDNGKCIEELTPTILSPNKAVEASASTTPILCTESGYTNSVITPSATGGNSGYTFEISDDYDSVNNTGTWTTISGDNIEKSAGKYYIKATDVKGCSDVSDVIEITNPNSIQIELSESTDCGHRYGAGAYVVVKLKTGDAKDTYEYKIGNGSWNDINFSSSADATDTIKSGIIVGSNTVTVRNKTTKCFAKQEVIIKDVLSFDASPVNPTACNNGSFVISNLKGGKDKYQFVLTTTSSEPTSGWSTLTKAHQTIKDAFVLDAPSISDGDNEFYIWMKDANGCTTYLSKTLTAAVPLNISATAIQKVCKKDKSKLKVTVTGGTPPYKIEVLDQGNGTVFKSLTDLSIVTDKLIDVDVNTTYKVRVIDTDSCDITTSDSFEMIEGYVLDATHNIIQPLCSSDKAIVKITKPTTGKGPYEYTLTNTTDNTIKVIGKSDNASITLNGVTSLDVTTHGNYKLVIVDKGVPSTSDGCPQEITLEEIKPSLGVLEFKLSKEEYSCDGKVTIKVEPKEDKDKAPSNVSYNYVLNSDYSKKNTTGEFVVDLTKTTMLHVDVVYVKDGEAVDINSACKVTAWEDTLQPKVFTVEKGAITDVKCKDDSNGTVKFTISNFDTTNGYFYQVDGTGDIKKDTSSELTVDGLSAGERSIVVSYSEDGITNTASTTCKNTFKVNIKEPNEALAIKGIDVTGVVCTPTGVSEGTITPSATGGWGEYSFYISTDKAGPWSDAAATFKKPVGDTDYYIKVVDKKECYKVSEPFKINEPNKPEISFAVTTDCANRYGADADIILTLNSGDTDATYQYSIGGSTFDTDFKFTNGTYTINKGTVVGDNIIKVRDKKTTCFVQDNITIKDVLSFVVTPEKAASCDNGSFVISDIKGGKPGYKFVLVGAPSTEEPKTGFTVLDANNTISVPNNLAIASGDTTKDYVIWIKDDNGCTNSVPTKLTKDTPLTVSFKEKENPKCKGLNGTITYNVKGGRAGYSVKLFKDGVVDDNYTQTLTAAGDVTFSLPGGTSEYHVVVTDEKECTDDTAIAKQTLAVGPTLSGSLADKPTIQPTCTTKYGSVMFVAPSPAISPNPSYVYYLELNSNLGEVAYESSTTTVTGVMPGVYTAFIKDTSISGGCPQNVGTVTLEELPTTPLFDTSLSYDCKGVPTLKITPKLNNKPSDLNHSLISKYNYIVKGVTTSTSINKESDTDGNAEIQLPIGDYDYYVSVNYLEGSCNGKPVKIEVEDKTFVVTDKVATPVTCFGGNKGKIKVTVKNAATTGFYYSKAANGPWTLKTGNTVEFDGLSAGPNTVYVSYDNVGVDCVIPVEKEVPNVPELKIVNVSTTEIKCDGNGGYTKGSITPRLEGDFSDRTYTFTVVNENDVEFSDLNQLDQGTYTVKVKDDKGCSTTYSKPVVLKDPIAVSFNLGVKECYSNDKQSTIVISDLLGSGNFYFQIKKERGVFSPVSPIKVESGGVVTYEIRNLQPNTYELSVVDDKNCSIIKNITIGKPITFTTSVKDQSCNNGSITVTASGGDGANYEYAFIPEGTTLDEANDFVTSKTKEVSSLSITNTSISYDLYVRSAGCISEKKKVTVVYIKPPTVAVDPAKVYQPTCTAKGSIIANIKDGTPGYTVTLYNATDDTEIQVIPVNGTVSNTSYGTVSFLNLDSGDYYVKVKDSNNCESAKTQDIILNETPQLPTFLGIKTPQNQDCKKYDDLPAVEKEKFVIGAYYDKEMKPIDLTKLTYKVYDKSTNSVKELTYKLETSIDGGVSWKEGHEHKFVKPYTSYNLVVRIKDHDGKKICEQFVGAGIMPDNVLGLILEANYDGICTNGFSVHLEVKQGIGPFQFSKDGGNTWQSATHMISSYVDEKRGITYDKLVIGQDYDFRVIDLSNGCIKRNIGKPDYPNPLPITGKPTNICFEDTDNSTKGKLNFVIDNTSGHLSATTSNDVDWTLYKTEQVHQFPNDTDSPLIQKITEVSGVGGTVTVPGNAKVNVPEITGLGLGDYFIKTKMKKAPHCEYASGIVSIIKNSEISGKLELVRNVTCDEDGIIKVVNISGGVGPYTYKVINGANVKPDTELVVDNGFITLPKSAVVDGQDSVTVSIQVIDSNGCTNTNSDNTETLAVSVIPEITTGKPNSCSFTDKKIEVKIVNAAILKSPYTYEYKKVSGTDWVTNSNILNTTFTLDGIVDSGDYVVRVKDANGCYSKEKTVEFYDNVDFNITEIDSSCKEGETTIKISDLKGSGNYTWEIVAGVGGTLPAPNPASGTITDNNSEVEIVVNMNTSYGIKLTDNNSDCFQKRTFETTEGAKPVFIPNLSVAKCADSKVELNFDNPKLTYTITKSTTAKGFVGAHFNAGKTNNTFEFTSEDISSEVKQDFVIRGTDVKGCFSEQIITVTIPKQIQVTGESTTQFTCTSANLPDTVNVSIGSSGGITGGSETYNRAELYKKEDGSNDELVASTSNVNLPINFELNSANHASGGDYYIRVYDDNGCFGNSQAVTLNAFDVLKSLDYNVVNATDCSGMELIHVNVVSTTNDSSKYTVVVANTSGTLTAEASNPMLYKLDTSKGSHTITVTHKVTGCSLVKEITTYSETPAITVNASPSPVLCKGGADGKVSFELTGYEGSKFTYKIYLEKETSFVPANEKGQGDQSNLSFVGLPAGEYQVLVSLAEYPGSGNGCTIKDTFVIDEPSEKLNLTVDIEDVSCTNGNDGSLKLSATNGWGELYKYKVEKVSFDTPNPDLSDPSSLTVVSNILVSPIGDGGFATDKIYKDLSFGYYKITVKDNLGCENEIKYVEVKNPEELNGTLKVDENSCNDKPAVVTVLATGGTSSTGNGTDGFTYVLYQHPDLANPLIEETSNIFEISGAGEYSIKVKDSKNCISDYIKFNGQTSFIIDDKLKVNTPIETEAVTCSASGFAKVSIASGSGSYSYVVKNTTDNTQADQEGVVVNGSDSFTFVTSNKKTVDGIEGEGGAIYSIEVTDLKANPVCIKTVELIVDEAIKPVFDINEVSSLCPSTNYQLRFTSSQNLTYSYALISGSNLVANIDDSTNMLSITKKSGVTTAITEDVTITATDVVTGCTTEVVKSVTLLNNIAPVSIVAEQFTCKTKNEKLPAIIKLQAAPSGGSGASYLAELWRVEAGGVESQIDSEANASAGTSFEVSQNGKYYVRLYDKTHICSVVSNVVNVGVYKPISPVTINPIVGSRSCTGIEKVSLYWSKVTPTTKVVLKSADGTVTEEITTVDTSVEYTIDESKGLPYTIVISDTDTGCKIEQTYSLSAEPTNKVSISKSDVVCKDTNSGKVSFDFVDSTYGGAFTFTVTETISSTNYSAKGTDKFIDNLPKGTYEGKVIMTDFPNCEIPVSFTILEPKQKLGITVTAKDVTCNTSSDGSLSVLANDGWGVYVYSFAKLVQNSSGGTIDPNEPSTYDESVLQTLLTNNSLSSLEAGYYKVTAQDNRGCQISEIVEIKRPLVITALTEIDEKVCDTNNPATLKVKDVVGGTVNGTTKVYKYVIYNADGSIYAGPQVSPDFTIAKAGYYNVKVFDGNGCSSVSYPVKIHNKLRFETIREKTLVTCKADGLVGFTIKGGSGKYTYKVTGANSGVVPTTVVGSEVTFVSDKTHDNQEYTIEVTDTAVQPNCTITDKFTVAAKEKPSFDLVTKEGMCTDDIYVLSPTNSDLTYTAVSSEASSKFDINIINGIINISKKSGVLELVSEKITVTGTDDFGNGCSLDVIENVTIGKNINVPVIEVTEFTCGTDVDNNVNVAKVTVASFTTGSNAPYTASLWKSGGTSPIQTKPYVSNVSFDINDYTGGDYYVKIYDKTNICTSTSNVSTVAPYVDLRPVVVTPIAGTRSCIGEEQVEIKWIKTSASTSLDVVVAGSSVKSYSGNSVGSTVITTVSVKDNTEIIIKDSKSSCELSTVYTLSGEPFYKLEILTTDVCDATSNTGTVKFNYVGSNEYSGAYTFEVFKRDASSGTIVGSALGSVSNDTFTGLASGNYRAVITMKDFPSCAIKKDFDILEPSTAIGFVDQDTKAGSLSCNGSSDGTLSFLANGGWGSYTYEVVKLVPGGTDISIQSGSSNTFISGLGAATYKVIVKDKKGCFAIKELEIKEPSEVNAKDITIVDYCTTDTPAQVTINGAFGGVVTGEKTTYKYVLFKADGTTIYSGPQSSNIFNIVDAGTYKVKVLNAVGCESDYIKFNGDDSFTIHPKLFFNIKETKAITCTNAGEATVNVLSGSGDYTITVNDPAGSPVTVTGTKFATSATDDGKEYTVTVVDNKSNSKCELAKPITITSPDRPVFIAKEIKSTCYDQGYVAIMSNTTANISYTVNPKNVAGASVSMVGEKLTVTSTDSSIDFNQEFVVTGTDSVTGCSTDVKLNVSIAGALKYSPAVATGFNCTLNTNDVAKANVSVTLDSTVDLASLNGASLYKGASGSGVLVANKTITDATISFDVEDYAGGDYYIKIFKGSCGTLTNVVNIPAFEVLKPYNLSVVEDTNCDNEQVIDINSSQLGVSIVLKDKTGVEVLPKSGTTLYTVLSDASKAPYVISIMKDATDCIISYDYMPNPPKPYVITVKEIQHAYCVNDKGQVVFGFGSQTPYLDTYSYEVYESGTTTAPVGYTKFGDMSVKDLAPGKYDLVVTLANGCDIKREFEINTSVPPLSIESITVKPIGCSNSTASMTINTLGQGKPFMYYVKNITDNIVISDWSYDNYLQGLSEGEYEIKVKDRYGCQVANAPNMLIEAPKPITGEVKVTNNVCNGDKSAEITVINPTGGVVDNKFYHYVLEHPDGAKSYPQESNVFSGLKANPKGKPYNVYVLGDGGCKSEPIPVNVEDPNLGTLVTNMIKPIDCTNTQKATIEVEANSPLGGPYSFMLLNPDGSKTGYVPSDTGDNKHKFSLIPNVNNEAYHIYAKDGKGCITDVARVVINDFDTLKAEIFAVKSKLTCFESNDGIIKASHNGGGVGTYTFDLLDENKVEIPEYLGQTSNQFTKLSVGKYYVRVNTSTGCSDISDEFVEITGPKELKLELIKIDHQKCVDVNKGVIVVKGVGGYSDGNGYKYTISSDANNGRVRDNGEFKNLAPGKYTITVFDENGTCPVSKDFEIIKADAITTKVQNIKQYSCSSNQKPSFEVLISGGIAPYYVDVNGTGNYVEVPNNGNVAYFGEAQGIKAGKSYLIFIKDSRGCRPVQTKLIEFESSLAIGLEVQPVYYDCSNSSFINATVNDLYKANVTYSLWEKNSNGGDTKTSENTTGEFIDMPAGNYYVKAVLSLGNSVCEDTSEVFEVSKITESLGFTIDTSEANTLIVNAFGGLKPYQYSFDGGVTFSDSNVLKYTDSGNYEIVVKDLRSSDINAGCPEVKTFFGEFNTIKIPNYFTPDGDGINDEWYPKNVKAYHKLEVIIYDRYSRKINSYKGIGKSWDGTYKGLPLPRGDYWYKVRYTELSGVVVNKFGNFTLYRKD